MFYDVRSVDEQVHNINVFMCLALQVAVSGIASHDPAVTIWRNIKLDQSEFTS